MTSFDRIIMFDAPSFRAIVYVDTNDVIVNNWQPETREFMHSTLTQLREWFAVHHPEFTETDVTGC